MAQSPENVLATSFHVQSLDPHTTIPDKTNRTTLIDGNGEVSRELLGT
jgi:hypothetical protein